MDDPITVSEGGWAEVIGDKSDPLTLYEVIQCEYSNDETPIRDWTTGNGYDMVPEGQPAIEVGGTYVMRMKLKLGEGTGNAFQGDQCTFDIDVMGAQSMDQDFVNPLGE